MKKKIFQLLNNVFRKFGYAIHSFDFLTLHPVYIDLRKSKKINTPINILDFKSDYNVFFILDIPVKKIRSTIILEAWKKMLQIYEKEEKIKNILERESYKFLKDFYRKYQPKNVIEFFDLQEEFVKTDYFFKHPLYAVYPWNNQEPEERRQDLVNSMKSEFKKNVEKTYHFEKDGWKTFGPISDELLKSEYFRLTTTFDSIKKEGYNEKYGFMDAIVFYDGEEYKVIHEEGIHRTAVLLALNYSHIPFRFSPKSTVFVNRKEYKNWRHVKSGLYSESQALDIFDKTIIPF